MRNEAAYDAPCSVQKFVKNNALSQWEGALLYDSKQIRSVFLPIHLLHFAFQTCTDGNLSISV